MARGQTQHEVEIRWLPFFLRPHMPPEGVLKQGKGAENVNPRLRAAGEAVGINFTGACDRAPNSTEAHALLAYAAKVSPDKQNALQEVLFRHYFTDGLYPAGANLAAAATEAGLDGAAAQAFAEGLATYVPMLQPHMNVCMLPYATLYGAGVRRGSDEQGRGGRGGAPQRDARRVGHLLPLQPLTNRH